MSKQDFIAALQMAISVGRAFAQVINEAPEDTECEVIETRYLDPGESAKQKGTELCE